MQLLTNTRRKTHSWYIFSGILVILYVYLWYINPRRRFASSFSGASFSSSSLYGILTLGQYGTSSYRLWARTNGNNMVVSTRNTVDSDYEDKPLSYWHDISLLPAVSPSSSTPVQPATAAKANELSTMQQVNFICEIPRNTKAKYEVHKTEGYNPIAQDTEFVSSSSSPDSGSTTVKESLRSYKWNSLINYGAIPQTYEHPGLKDPLTDKYGDGDPIDIVDLCPIPCVTGEIYTVNILGSLAMEDDGGTVTDYKIVSIKNSCPYYRTIVTDAPGKDTGIPFLMNDLKEFLPTLHIDPHNRRITHNTIPSTIRKDVWEPTAAELRTPFEDNPSYASIDQSSFTSNPNEITEWSYPVKNGPGSVYLGSIYDDVWKVPQRSSTSEQLRYLTNILLSMRLWFRDYKLKIPSSSMVTDETNPQRMKQTGKMNTFSFNGYYLDRTTTEHVLHHTHHSWCILLTQLYYNILIESSTIENLLSSVPLPSLNQAIARIKNKDTYIQSFLTIKDDNPNLDTAGIISRPIDIQRTQDYLRQEEKEGKLSATALTTLREHHATISLLFTIDRLFDSSNPSCLMYF